jgi:hypothetical protein
VSAWLTSLLTSLLHGHPGDGASRDRCGDFFITEQD